MAKGKYEQWLTEDGLTTLKSWARLGLIDEDLAKNMEISTKTLYEWKNKYSKIREALTYAKAKADAIVENALYKRAIGYSYDEVTQERRKTADGKGYEMVVTKVITKFVVPDTTAQIYWLKNRKPDMWRDNTSNITINNQVNDDPITQSIKEAFNK